MVSADIAVALALAVAAIAVVAWLLRVGFLADLLSRPVLVGYMAGVAVTMIVSQLPNLTGIDSSERDTVPRALDVLRHLDDLEVAPLLVGAGVVAEAYDEGPEEWDAQEPLEEAAS